MKKYLLILIIFLFPVSTAFAITPKLTADCSVAADNVTGAELQLDAGTWTAIPVVQTCVGQTETVNCTAPAVTVCYDTATIPNGPHTAKLRWTNLWGPSSDSAPLSFTKVLPSSSPTLRVK